MNEIPKNNIYDPEMKKLVRKAKGIADPGIYVKTLAEHPDNIAAAITHFYNYMQKQYPTFDVISTATINLPYGPQVYITYRI